MKNKTKSFQINDNITEVFIGDSHIQGTIKDSLLPRGINIGNSGESYYLSYFKLVKLLGSNANIQKVYLGFSYHNISGYYYDFVYGKFSSSVVPSYYYILPANEQMKLLVYNYKTLPAFLKNSIKSAADILRNRVAFEGGYINIFDSSRADRKSMDKRINFQFYKEGEIYPFSSLNLDYLNKISALCKEHHVELILVSTPLHPYFLNKIPVEYIRKYDSIIYNGNYHVIDLHRMLKHDDEFIPDGDHVSVKGAMLTTRKFLALDSVNLPVNNDGHPIHEGN
ncbi:MAG: hypothetical protein ABIT96_13070 [Ferruginibacter sp.]